MFIPLIDPAGSYGITVTVTCQTTCLNHSRVDIAVGIADVLDLFAEKSLKNSTRLLQIFLQ